MTPARIIVIGGGITGLAAAWRIQQTFQKSKTPVALQLLDASAPLGGTIKTIQREGFLLEMGADCFLSEKPRGVGLCKELGLEPELISTRPAFRRSFILKQGKFHPIPEGFYLIGPSRYGPFLESELLSWKGKLRALMERILPGSAKTDESLADFVRRRFGQELLDVMAQPLVAGIYGASSESLSLRSTFPQFLEMERTYGSVILGLKRRQDTTAMASGARYNLFVTLRRGMQTLTDSITAKLGTTVIQAQARVKEIRYTTGGWQVMKASGTVLTADAVCLALPSYAAAEILRPCDNELSSELAAIAYSPAATIQFAFRQMDVKRPLEGIGFVVPEKEKRGLLGCTWAHNKFEGRAPKGFVLLRAFLGGAHSAWMQEKDEPLAAKVYADLKAWFEITGKPLFTHVERYDKALPQFKVGHLPRVLKIEERVLHHPGLFLAGNWSYGIGIPDCIESGERAAEDLMAYLARPAPGAS